ncbi:MAG TPA: NUDIX hydrolase, partial [Ktedonobacterales bacterium]|nr:NUDIX hydrolase [Ktedonobacterales bacterium]
MSKAHVVFAFSAGGVVFRRGPDDAPEQLLADAGAAEAPIEVALVGRLRENVWTLPKGTPRTGETQEETALREVREETGLTVRIIAELGSIHYWFSRRGVRYKKEVTHFLMTATGGDLALHDHEYDEARWFPLAEATQRLIHENEIAMVQRAAACIRRLE